MKTFYILKESENRYGLYEVKENGYFNAYAYQWKFFKTPERAASWAENQGFAIK